MTAPKLTTAMAAALKLLDEGHPPRIAAQRAGVHLESLYRAMRRYGKGTRCPTCGHLTKTGRKLPAAVDWNYLATQEDDPRVLAGYADRLRSGEFGNWIYTVEQPEGFDAETWAYTLERRAKI